MSRISPAVLDDAATRVLDGETPTAILSDHPAAHQALAPLLAAVQTLAACREIELPSAEAASADRNAFLAELTHLQLMPPSTGPISRLREWFAPHRPRSRGVPRATQEKNIMNTLVAKLILSGLLLFGGLGGTAAVAADSLPDSPVYALKLAMEQTRLALTSQPEQAARLHLALAEERAREVERLALKGTPAGAAALTRLEQQLQLALDAAADIGDDATLARLLQDAQERFELRVRQLEQARLRSQERVGEPLLQAQGLLNRARAQASLGSQDPHLFRERHGYGRPATAPPQPEITPPAAGTPAPGGQRQYRQQGSQPGPSEPGGCPLCTPTGDQHQYGPQPDQPGPGEPSGNPTCPDCTPVGDQHQYGPQPDQPGPGEPGGSGSCPLCTPEGSQNQYSGDGGGSGSSGGPGGNH